MAQMIKKGKSNLAEEYLKKCMVYFSSRFDLLASILNSYASLIKKFYPAG